MPAAQKVYCQTPQTDKRKNTPLKKSENQNLLIRNIQIKQSQESLKKMKTLPDKELQSPINRFQKPISKDENPSSCSSLDHNPNATFTQRANL